MLNVKKYGNNFLNLILGKSTLNIGDSFYMVAISVAFVEIYHIDVSKLSLFALLSMLPGALAFLYGVYIERIENKKIGLVITQVLHLVLLLLMIFVMYNKLNIIFVYILNILFMLVNTISSSLDISIVPNVLNYDDELIDKSIDIQYMTGNVLNIASDFIASVLLGIISYMAVMQLSIPFFVAGIYFFFKLKMNSISQKNNSIQEDVHMTYLNSLSDSFNNFKTGKFASYIILSEAFLSGAIDMLLKLTPLYLILINVDIKWVGLVYATQKLADLIGAFISPYVNISIKKFFYIDYIITGILMTLVFVLPNPFVKLGLFFISFVIIGISGNYFNKMLFKFFDNNKLSSLMTIIHTFYAVFGIIFLIIPIFYSNIKILGIILNLFTFVFGFILILTTRIIPKIE